jgi:hypothetical protein
VLAAEETARELLAIRQGVPQPAVLFVSGDQAPGVSAGMGREPARQAGSFSVSCSAGRRRAARALHCAYVFIGFFGAEKGVTADWIHGGAVLGHLGPQIQVYWLMAVWALRSPGAEPARRCPMGRAVPGNLCRQ